MPKYSNSKIAEIIEEEGLGYAVMEYLSENSIEDPELAKLWQIARVALRNIENFLEEEEE